ncbi:restriction endonuclease subunit S [Noviherbaspirillum sedimenti]|nr:restriction endonuclease subunit S [Noviherbaspirillum sedimenti]
MSEWEQTTVGRFISLQRGYDLTEDEREPGNVPVMGAAGQNGFHNRALAPAPGIIMGRCGGSFGQIHFANEDFWPHNTAMFVTDFKGNDPYFAYYFLKNLDFSKLNSGSAQPSLNRNYVYPIKISVPLPAAQKKIANVLSTLDAKIDCNNCINAELEAMAKTLYDYWFVQFDFPDANGKPYKSSGGKMVYNAMLKREIPIGWDAVQLDEIVDEVRDNVTPMDLDGNTPYIGLEHIARKSIVLENWALAEKATSNKTAFCAGDILFGKIRPYFHKVGFAMMDGIASTDAIVMRARNASLVGLALQTVFSDRFVEAATASSTGSKMPRADWSVLKQYGVALPNYATQTLLSYQQLFNLAITKIERHVRENRELTQLRDWLLPLLMNGQVTVA